MRPYPFRLGTTSYILPGDILMNVQYLIGRVQDIELVLFEVDEDAANLPPPDQIMTLSRVARDNDLTYTIHLPLDLRLADDGSLKHASLEKAKRVIDRTRDLNPWAYVLHLDGEVVRRNATIGAMRAWRENATRLLEIVGQWAGDVRKLAVENVEGYPLDFCEAVLERVPVSRAVDIGHLWLDRQDPVEYLRNALPRTSVVHVHGVDGRDHKSLDHVPTEQLRAVLDELLKARYGGVLTVEVFSESDFIKSCAAIEAALGTRTSVPDEPGSAENILCKGDRYDS